MVGTANHVGDAHVDVVNDDAELIHGLAELFVAFSGAQEDEIFDFVVREFRFAKNHIGEFRHATQGNFETHGWLRAGSGRLAVPASTARDAARAAALGFFVLAGLGVVAARIFFGGAVAQKGAAVREALFRGFAVEFGALGLVERPFVPLDAEPFEAVDNPGDEFGLVSFGVGVFNPEDHLAVLPASEKPVKQGCSRPADVQISRRGRGEPDPHAVLCFVGHLARVYGASCALILNVQSSERDILRPIGTSAVSMLGYAVEPGRRLYGNRYPLPAASFATGTLVRLLPEICIIHNHKYFVLCIEVAPSCRRTPVPACAVRGDRFP